MAQASRISLRCLSIAIVAGLATGALAGLTACGAPAAEPLPQTDAGVLQPEPDAGSGSGDADAGTDAGTPPAPCTEDGACFIDWADLEPYPVAVDHHTTFVHEGPAGAYLHVMGGVRVLNEAFQAMYPQLRRAKIGANGSLGEWEVAGTLPASLSFHGLARAGDRTYLVAGLTTSGGQPSVNGVTYVLDYDSEGKPTVRTGSGVAEAFLHPGVASVGGRLYVVGGSGTTHNPKGTVLVSTLGEDGLNGAWSAGPGLPQPRSHHAVVVHDERMYLVGGFTTGQVPLNDVLRSVHDATGALTGWEAVGTLESSPWTHAAFVHGEWLYVVGGGEGGPGQERYVARTRRARIAPDGTLGEFEEVAGLLPVPRAHVHQTPVHDGRIYSVGGRLFPALTTIDRVFIGTFLKGS